MRNFIVINIQSLCVENGNCSHTQSKLKDVESFISDFLSIALSHYIIYILFISHSRRIQLV